MPLRIDFLDRRAHAFFYMQQSTKRLVTLVTNDEIAAIDDFRFENRMRNRSDAVRTLLKLALDQIGGWTKSPRSLMMRTRAKKKKC